jgi:hypothetical protein
MLTLTLCIAKGDKILAKGITRNMMMVHIGNRSELPLVQQKVSE